MFSIPIKKTSSRNELLIKDALISYENFDFRQKLSILLEQSYKKTPFYEEINQIIHDLVLFDTPSLSLYTTNMIEMIARKLGITTEFCKLSTSGFISDSKKGNLILVDGKIHTREYKKDGESQYVTEIVANRIKFLNPKPEVKK